jgi:hypothetical protein
MEPVRSWSCSATVQLLNSYRQSAAKLSGFVMLRYKAGRCCAERKGKGLSRQDLASLFRHAQKRPLFRVAFFDVWLREPDLNRRPSGYEPDELPDCSIPRLCGGILQPNDEVSTFNEESRQINLIHVVGDLSPGRVKIFAHQVTGGHCLSG